MQIRKRNHNEIADRDEGQQNAHLSINFDADVLRQLVTETLKETFELLEWPAGRVCLTEEEAAAACGVGRHVLRDLRLAGRLNARKLGKRYVYRRCDLIEAIECDQADFGRSSRLAGRDSE